MLAELVNLNNLDLLIVGIVIASTGVLGFVVYFSNRKSITNRTFLYFSVITALWGVVNYFSYKFTSSDLLLWLFRFLLFFAVFQSFYLYRLLLVFPKEKYSFSIKHKYILTPLVLLISILTLSNYVFKGIIGEPTFGQVAVVDKGVGLIFFALLAIGLVMKAFVILIKKIKNSNNLKEKGILRLLLIGLIIMFSLIIFFNLILATVFSNPRFIPLGALFIFPFIIFASYSIFKQKLFNVKVAVTSVLVFSLSVVLLFEVVFSNTLLLIIFRSCVFFLVLVFGVNLIRSVLKEVQQRERLEQLRLKLEESNIKLEDANERLKGLDKLKTEFLSLASHQLRSPLTAIKGYISMIIEGDYGKINKEAMEIIERVFQSSQNLTKVVEDLLNVSKIEQGGMKYEMAPFSLVNVASNMAKDLSISAEKKNLKMSFESDDESLCMVNGDEGKIRQVVLNLIDNSIKYTKEGSINISVRRVGDKVICAIKDTGMGMTEEIKQSLFQKFSRGEGARMNTSGSGLGLYLGKEIIVAHKGRIWVDSPGPNKGSTFSVELEALK